MKQSEAIVIGIVAPSSPAPVVELGMGIKRIESAGFKVKLHPNTKKKAHLFYAGTESERSEAFYEFAKDDEVSIIWCARGGYGSNHLLPYLDDLTQLKGSPSKKILVGASDSTALFEFVRSQWGWHTLHAPMPALGNFALMTPQNWKILVDLLSGHEVHKVWKPKKLRFIGDAPTHSTEGLLIGGNLAVFCAMTGTPYQTNGAGSIVFLEEINETFSKIDRMVQQLDQSGRLKDIKGIVLGTFLGCEDPLPSALIKEPDKRTLKRIVTQPKASETRPLRAQVNQRTAFQEIFGKIGKQYGIPVAHGLPVGHGPGGQMPLPLGITYKLGTNGQLEIVD